ncbi:MAG: prepilin-type N-terminal cleavage/methylation domain-containing protein [Candidatus Nanopelagicaceae bacterium]
MISKSNLKNDEGFSLLEVLVAVVVLALVGTALLNGISSGNLQAKKTTNNQINFNYLTAAAENIAKANFVTCNKNIGIPQIYKDAIATSNTFPVQVLKVEALYTNGSSGTWYDCVSWPDNAPASFLQKITIVNTDSSTNKQCQTNPLNVGCTRVVFKNLTSVNSSFSVTPINPTSLFDGKSKSISLTTQNAAADAQIIYFILPGSNLSTTCASDVIGANLNLSTLTLCAGANYSGLPRLGIDVGAFDIKNSVYATPASILLDVFDPIVLNSISPITEVGALKFTSGTTVQLSASGGNGYNISYSTDPSNPLLSGVVISSSGLVTLSGSGITTSGKKTIYTLISGSGQDSGEATSGNFQIDVRSPLTLQSVSGTGSSGNPCSGTATTTCTILFKTPAGSGVGPTPIPTLNPVATTNVTYNSKSYSYDSVAQQWTLTLSLTYNASLSTNGFCKSKGAGIWPINATVTDAFIPSTSTAVSFYLKC